jgi:hypothetical protein
MFILNKLNLLSIKQNAKFVLLGGVFTRFDVIIELKRVKYFIFEKEFEFRTIFFS